MKTEKLTVKIKFISPCLAMCSGNKSIMEEFIASKAPTAEAAKEEIESIDVDANVEKTSTVFPRDNGKIFVWDYQWRGYLKSALKTLIESKDAPSGVSVWTAAKAVDKFLFVDQRRIFFTREGKQLESPDGTEQRPLRATTLRGDRICLARSERVDEGAEMQFTLTWIVGKEKSKLAVFDRELVEQMLSVGELQGFGQWNGGGWGKFSFSVE